MGKFCAILVTLSLLCGPVAGQDDVVVWQRGPEQVVVYDARPELGIGMHAYTQEQLKLLAPLGIRLVRTTLYWKLMEPGESGAYEPKYLEKFDQLVHLADATKICLLVVVHDPPQRLDWAHRDQAYQRFAAFMAAMARRYPSIRYWELFNEMDGAFTDIFGAGRKEVPMLERGKLYAAMLKQAYPAIKAANPQAWVLTGGMTDWRDFPRGIYEGGGKACFDVMNIHTYGLPVLWAFIDRGQTVKETMKWAGDGDKPLWNSEFGVDAGNFVAAWGYPHAGNPPREDGPAFDAMQIEQWRDCIEWNQKNRLYQKILPYQFAAGNERNDDGHIAEKSQLPAGMTIDDYGFGMMRRDGLTPRPLYWWLVGAGPNRSIVEHPLRTLDVRYNPIFALPPEAEAVQWRSHSLLKRIEIDSLYPRVLSIR